ncbi:hypothetical protein HPP92_015899 [Vanilla planifolia]|uniref:Uncharacterized protein n=1 Tax=Vanilla planifolia TaxID=51239 RepID=A0A835QUG2_VANPL|nr:hypothetical protein HPP92_015899 [Vanilla planifolia]
MTTWNQQSLLVGEIPAKPRLRNRCRPAGMPDGEEERANQARRPEGGGGQRKMSASGYWTEKRDRTQE